MWWNISTSIWVWRSRSINSLETGSSSHQSLLESLHERNTSADGAKKEMDRWDAKHQRRWCRSGDWSKSPKGSVETFEGCSYYPLRRWSRSQSQSSVSRSQGIWTEHLETLPNHLKIFLHFQIDFVFFLLLIFWLWTKNGRGNITPFIITSNHNMRSTTGQPQSKISTEQIQPMLAECPTII